MATIGQFWNGGILLALGVLTHPVLTWTQSRVSQWERGSFQWRVNPKASSAAPGPQLGSADRSGLGRQKRMMSSVCVCVCARVHETVGTLWVDFNIPVSLEAARKENPAVQRGGRFKPSSCEALQKVAIIIPFRKREEHLKYWLYYLHPILQRQQLDYGVYVINQVPPHVHMCTLMVVALLHRFHRSVGILSLLLLTVAV